MIRAVVHSLEQARAALRHARDTGESATLYSARGAAAALGVGVWRAMADLLRDEFPGLEFVAALDCADDAGAAVAAVLEGVSVRFDGPPETANRLADIAARTGAYFETGARDAVDLSARADADAVRRALSNAR